MTARPAGPSRKELSGRRAGQRCLNDRRAHLIEKHLSVWGSRLQRLLECRGGLREHLIMIEGQRRQVVERKPPGGCGVVSCLEMDPVGADDRPVSDRHNPAAGIATRIAKGVELIHGEVGQTGLFSHFPPSGVERCFSFIDKPAGNGPAALEGVFRPLDQEDLQRRIIGQTENNAVGCQTGAGKS